MNENKNKKVEEKEEVLVNLHDKLEVLEIDDDEANFLCCIGGGGLDRV